MKGEPTTRRSDSFSRSHDESESDRALEGHVDRPPDIEFFDEAQDDHHGGTEADENGEDGFGDDFDDFEEGEEVEGEDFDDFGEAVVPSPIPTPALPQTPLAGLLAGLVCSTNFRCCKSD